MIRTVLSLATALFGSIGEEQEMKNQFGYVIAAFLVSLSLILSACRPLPQTVPPSATLAPTNTPTQAKSIPSTTPAPTATAGPSPTPAVKVLWTFQTEGPIWGTPTVSDGTVYFGSDDNNLYAVEVQNSQLKWKFTAQGIVRSRPALGGGLVYFASDDGYLYALGLQTGKLVWRRDIGNLLSRDQRQNLGTSPDPTGFDYYQSSPAVANGQVYVGSLDGNVYALAADTGKIIWTFKTGEKVRATPTVDNGTLYIGSWDKTVYALDALTGVVRWKTWIGGQVQTTALVADGMVYCASRKASVVALDAKTGEIKWEYAYGFNMWVESSPQLVNGIIYIGSSGSQMVVGLEGQTGNSFTIFYSKAFHWSTPAIVKDTLYIGGTSFKDTEKGGLYALKLVNGKFAKLDQYQWLLPVKSTLEASRDWSGVSSSPVLADSVIYFGGLDGKLYSVRDQS